MRVFIGSFICCQWCHHRRVDDRFQTLMAWKTLAVFRGDNTYLIKYVCIYFKSTPPVSKY
jgi:hypothetical protein